MKHLNPEVMQAGDICVTTDFYPMSCVTRSNTWPHAPRPHLGMGLSTHAFMVADRGDKIYYACEMRPRLRMTELQRYDNPRWSLLPHIVACLRHPALDNGPDTEQIMERMNDFMIRMHSCGVKYGWEDIWRRIGWKGQDNPARIICSEWCRKVFFAGEIVTPWKQDQLVIPRDWQEWTALHDINIYK